MKLRLLPSILRMLDATCFLDARGFLWTSDFSPCCGYVLLPIKLGCTFDVTLESRSLTCFDGFFAFRNVFYGRSETSVLCLESLHRPSKRGTSNSHQSYRHFFI